MRLEENLTQSKDIPRAGEILGNYIKHGSAIKSWAET